MRETCSAPPRWSHPECLLHGQAPFRLVQANQRWSPQRQIRAPVFWRFPLWPTSHGLGNVSRLEVARFRRSHASDSGALRVHWLLSQTPAPSCKCGVPSLFEWIHPGCVADQGVRSSKSVVEDGPGMKAPWQLPHDELTGLCDARTCSARTGGIMNLARHGVKKLF